MAEAQWCLRGMGRGYSPTFATLHTASFLAN